MKIMVAGGTGFIGKHLITQLLKQNMNVAVIGRDKNKIIKLYGDSVYNFHWDELTCKEISNYDVIINLAGQNISEKRWDKNTKKNILESRVNTTRTLAQLCSQLGKTSPRILNANAVGIYGKTGSCSRQPIPVDESWKIKATYISDFLSEVAWQWERALDVAIAGGVSVTIMRFGIVLNLNEGMLEKLSLPVKWGLAGKWGDGQQWISWIHIDDLVSAIIFLINHSYMIGPVNLTHPTSVTQSEFICLLATYYHRPCFFNMPAWVIKWLLGERGEELLLNGQKVSPTKLINAGFHFSKKTINDVFIE